MRALVVGFTVLACRATWAAEYGGDASVRSRDELLALAAAGELDDDALDELLALYDAPIDPATATADELALLPGLGRAEARAMVEAGAGFGDLARDQLGAYARESPRYAAHLNLGGVYRTDAMTEGYARLRLTPTTDTSIGALVVTRPRTRVTSSSGRLVSDGPRREVGLERWHLVSSFGRLRLIVGSYACSFGESVTFSVARRPYAPSLFVVDELVRSQDGSTVRPAPALRGLAARLAIGRVELDAFASYRGLDLYQYGEWLHDGDTPDIVTPHGDSLRYVTAANMARERLVGAGLSVRDSDQNVGLIAYVASLELGDPKGVVSPSSRYPTSPYFGAGGAYAIAQIGPARLHGEVSATLSGGLGAVARADIALTDNSDVSVSGRYYGLAYDNPYARSYSEPDLYEGARARNERGVAVESTVAVADIVRLAGLVDVWTSVSVPALVKARMRGRALVALSDNETVTVEGQRVDKDLTGDSGDTAYTGVSCSTNELDDCARGVRMTGTARAVTTRIPKTRLAVGLRRTLEDGTQGALIGETRFLAHASVGPWRWLTVAAVVSQRLSSRVAALSDSDRVATLTASADTGGYRLEVFARSEARWVNDAERTTTTLAVDMQVQL